MVYRIYVAKKPEFANEANALAGEIKNLLKIDGVKELKVINRYDVEDIEKELFDKYLKFRIDAWNSGYYDKLFK